MILIKQKSDIVGIYASSLCLVHCVASPFIFIAQTSRSSHSHDVPSWWGLLDFVFLIISFFSVYRSTQKTSKNWIKPALWVSLLCLFIIVINEKINMFYIHHKLLYIPIVALIILHFYNRKFCNCNVNTCCSNGTTSVNKMAAK